MRPVSIEFLAFAESRLHLRTRFTKKMMFGQKCCCNLKAKK
ncbi:hypothetical protein CWB73_05100 [Pseudoalteromonas phenolica]|uniref:Uncharacterized protein n=1 Tax=Pseudoalteromonas phenolica TaxID=161398 RepID=A0A5S3YWZ5_9GAMM|nr:hypothetical protein CWB73_05100 [Pseudoalteromonas phenolica]